MLVLIASDANKYELNHSFYTIKAHIFKMLFYIKKNSLAKRGTGNLTLGPVRRQLVLSRCQCIYAKSRMFSSKSKNIMNIISIAGRPLFSFPFTLCNK